MENTRNIKKVLVTGNEGYIGSVLTGVLSRAGYEVVGLDWGVFGNVAFIPRDFKSISLQIRKDIRDAELRDFEGIDAVVHLAAISNDPAGELNPEATYSINYKASAKLAFLAKQAGVRRFLFSSSCSIYGVSGETTASEESAVAPQSYYAKSKIMAEEAISRLADKNFCPVFLRNATVFGVSPRMRLDLLVQNLAAYGYLYGAITILSDGSPWRPSAHILDVAEAFKFFLEAPSEKICRRAFNIGSDKNNLRVKEVAEIIKNYLPGTEIEIKNSNPIDARSYKVDFSKIHSLGFRPRYDIDYGIEEICSVFRNTHFQEKDFLSADYITLKKYQRLIDAGKMDKFLKIIS